MKKAILVFVLLPFFSAMAAFKIPPYTLRSDTGEIQMKFLLSAPALLKIERETLNRPQIKREIRKGLFSPFTVHTVNLGPQDCDENLFFTIQEVGGALSEIFPLAVTEVPGIPCNKDEALAFGFISDTQHAFSRDHRKMARVILKRMNHSEDPLRFILHGGDIVDKGGLESLWRNYFSIGNSYHDKIPHIAALGNHEFYKDGNHGPVPLHFRKYFRWEEAPAHLLYSFPHFNLIVFNSNFDRLSPEERTVQWQWLEKSLEKSKRDGKKVIITFHHAPFTSSPTKFGFIHNTLRSKLVPLLEKAGNVSLVLAGHQHLYERSFKKGIHYVVAGPAGGFKSLPLLRNPYRRTVKTLQNTLVVVKVQGQKVSVKTFNSKNRVIDSLEFIN